LIPQTASISAAAMPKRLVAERFSRARVAESLFVYEKHVVIVWFGVEIRDQRRNGVSSVRLAFSGTLAEEQILLVALFGFVTSGKVAMTSGISELLPPAAGA